MAGQLPILAPLLAVVMMSAMSVLVVVPSGVPSLAIRPSLRLIPLTLLGSSEAALVILFIVSATVISLLLATSILLPLTLIPAVIATLCRPAVAFALTFVAAIRVVTAAKSIPLCPAPAAYAPVRLAGVVDVSILLRLGQTVSGILPGLVLCSQSVDLVKT